jgi:hypothetical protein
LHPAGLFKACTAWLALAVAGLSVRDRLCALWYRAGSESAFRRDPDRPYSFVAISIVLLAVVVAASSYPARRAAAIDPMAAITSE